MKDQSKANSTGNGNYVVSRKVLRLQNSTRARRVCVAVVFVALYVVLDRSTVFFQMWTGVSAWYPPSGLSLAMLIGFGGSYIPLIMLGGVISALTNYHQSLLSFNTIGANLAVSGGYWAAAYVLRRVLKIDWQLRSIRDVFRLLVVSVASSCAVAFAGVLMGVADHAIKPSEYLSASITWWVGDAVTLASLTPFLLVYVMPWLLRFCRLPAAKGEATAAKELRCVSARTRCWCGSNRCSSLQASAEHCGLCFWGVTLTVPNSFIFFFCRLSGWRCAGVCAA